jgi:hypothetical protein
MGSILVVIWQAAPLGESCRRVARQWPVAFALLSLIYSTFVLRDVLADAHLVRSRRLTENARQEREWARANWDRPIPLSHQELLAEAAKLDPGL